jgi:hypothetical protein
MNDQVPSKKLLEGLRHNERSIANEPWLQDMCGNAADEIERLESALETACAERDHLQIEMNRVSAHEPRALPEPPSSMEEILEWIRSMSDDEAIRNMAGVAIDKWAAIQSRASQPPTHAPVRVQVAHPIRGYDGSLDCEISAEVASRIAADNRHTELPGVEPNPNEGPINAQGLVQLDDGVLPAFYNQWKCSQCGRDPRDVKFNGCGYSQSCGRVATPTKEVKEADCATCGGGGWIRASEDDIVGGPCPACSSEGEESAP